MYRQDFPIFNTFPDLIYLDSASTAQKPQYVIDRMADFFRTSYANIHRGAYMLSEQSESLYEASKEMVAKCIGAESRHEIVYGSGATGLYNILARSLVKTGWLRAGDRVVLSRLEHHANIVPWQIIAEEYGIMIEWVDITSDGRIDLDDLGRRLHGARVLSLTGASNVTGAVTDFTKIKSLIDALEVKPIFVVDASQYLPHLPINVQECGIDFLIATGHKMMSDTGIGFLYGKKELLKELIPAHCGGGAINRVTEDGYIPAGLPYRHEPGTPHIAGAVSLLYALEYVDRHGGYEAVQKYEHELMKKSLQCISSLPETVRLIGPTHTDLRLPVFSLAFDAYHAGDMAETLAMKGIAVRAGHHCTEPLHRILHLPATLRMSLGIYSVSTDIEKAVEIIRNTL